MRDEGAGAPTREMLLERARALVPVLRERAAACERARRMPEESHRDFVEAGFYRIHQPAPLGGFELDFGLVVDLAAELGRGCASSAWVFAQLAGHAYLVGSRGIEAQRDMWGDDPDATISSAFPTQSSSVTRAEGGWLLDGAWNFASGCDVATWNEFTCMVPRDGGGPPLHVFCMAPRADWRIEDDWFPSGLAGTGSKTLILDNVFVPDHRTLVPEDCTGGPTAGSAVNPCPLYRLPLMATGGALFTGTVLGAVRGAYEVLEAQFASRSSVGGVRLAEQQSVQMRFAEAAALIDAGWALSRQDCAEAMAWAARGEQPPVELRTTWRRNAAHGIRLWLDALDRVLQPLAGGRGLAADSPFQRAWRDAHAAAAQITVSWDLMATQWGRLRMGLEPLDRRI